MHFFQWIYYSSCLYNHTEIGPLLERRSRTAMALLLLLIVAVTLHETMSQSCHSGYEYLKQPPTMLDCDPLGTDIKLQCVTSSLTNNVTWYWTRNVSEAGINGTTILPGDTNGNYRGSNISTNNREIGFTVNESTLGYYWCEISNAVNISLRPSIITPVCLPMNRSQQNKCTWNHVIDLHHYGLECAEENSLTRISRLPLPTNCGALATSSLVITSTRGATSTKPPALTTSVSIYSLPTTVVNNPAPSTKPPALTTSVSIYPSPTTLLLLPSLATQHVSSVSNSTDAPAASTNKAITIIPLVLVLMMVIVTIVVASITVLMYIFISMAQHYRDKRHKKFTEKCIKQGGISQQEYGDAGELKMTDNIAYISFLMSPHSGNREEVIYEAVGV